MKSKELQKLKDQSAQELMLSAQKLKEEIARMGIEGSINKPKNTNALGKKKQELAVVLTILNEKSQ
ncbi:MAG: 50S ribosomal protein L29 [Microgenomates bacterium OLB23]|nr:MAG: 50S ribosomal protein L29 [Microgenomates bacterium OLB23]